MTPQVGQLEQSQDMATMNGHQGISFDEWLDLFLDLAVGLATMHRREEAYKVCEAARDSTVFGSLEHNFAIYITWSGQSRPAFQNTVTNSSSLRYPYQ